MEKFDLSGLLKSSGKRMQQELAERLIDHPGELGVDRETIVRQFLRAYLPKRFDVTNGFAFDTHGNVSRQLDVIVVDSNVSPVFKTAGGVPYYPCESIVSVGQVKSSIKSRAELYEALANLESAKSLDRSAGGRAFDMVHGEPIDNRTNYLHQIFTFLFVTGKVLSTKTMHDEILENVIGKEPHLWTNVIVAPSNYLVTFTCEHGVCPNPMDARGVALQIASEEHDVLMKFYLLLGQAIQVTRTGSFPYSEYLKHAHQWTAKVFYSATDMPPPLLSSFEAI